MKCPECGNVVPANALNCDCGDEFSSKPQTPLDQQDAPKFTLLGDDPDLRLGKAGSGPTEVEKAAFFEVLRESTPRLFITPILLGLNLLVFALMIFSGVSPLEPTGRELLQWGANFGPFTVNNGWWRIFACTFLHIGFMHLAFNMWCLWSLGSLAERLFGNWTFLMLYVLSGLGGSICSLLWNPKVVSAGASGAIFGVAGGLVMFWRLGHLSVPKSVIKSDLNSLLLFVGYNLFYGLTSEGVDNAGHVGGLLVGLLMGAFLHRPLPSRKPVVRLRRYLVYSGVTLLLVLGAGGGKGRLANDPLAKIVGALGEIKDARAVDPLIAALKDELSVVRNRAAEALGEINSRSAAGVLNAALKDKNLEVVAGAYRFFIRRGEEGTEDVLIAALNEHGDEFKALGFLDCGNPKLEAAAVTWAQKRGLEIPTLRDEYGSADLRWGSGR